MTFQEGWLNRQIELANEEINAWSDSKKEVMIKNEEPQVLHFQPENEAEVDQRG